MSNSTAAYNICDDVLADDRTSEFAKSYAQAVLDQQMTGEKLDVQMSYVASNTRSEYQERIAVWRGVSSISGFSFGYCQLCGNRDGDSAYHGQDEDARGLVCVDCYEEWGSPKECDDCGDVTYEGDSMVSGPHEGKFFCNPCLQAL